MSGHADRLPRGWRRATLPELVAADGVLTDGDWVESVDQDPKGEVRLTQLADVGDGVFRDRSDRYMARSRATELRCTFLEKGDVLIARMPDPLGRACLFPGAKQPCVTVVDVCIVRPGSAEVHTPWLMHFINSPQFRSKVASLQAGSTRKRISKANLSTIELPVPPPGEQESIAATVDTHFSRLDAASATLERVQRALARYRASVLKAAVEGRLVPTEAELARKEGRSYEPASVLLKRILAERRRRWEEAELAKLKAKGKAPTDDRWKARYVEPAAPDNDLPELPEGWCWANLGQLLTHLTSGSRDWTDHYDRGTGVFLMAQNVRPGRLDLSFVQHVDPPPTDASCARSQVEEGDLLVTIVGANTGDVCRVPRPLPKHYVCQSVALMRPGVGVQSRYLDAYLNSPPGQSVFDGFMYGQGRPHLAFEQLETTPVPLPPGDEAERIAAAVEDKISVAATVAAPIHANNSRIARLRQSILKWAFEGRIVDGATRFRDTQHQGPAHAGAKGGV